jgi:hypothetical protein
LEAKYAAIELERPFKISDLEMDVADAHLGVDCIGIIAVCSSAVHDSAPRIA